MPKLKTHSGAKKRFSLTKSGKVKRAHAFKSHLLNGHGKDTKRKRGLRAGAYADKGGASRSLWNDGGVCPGKTEYLCMAGKGGSSFLQYGISSRT